MIDEASKQDIIGLVWRFVVALSDANQGRTDNLSDCRNHVARDEKPENELFAQAVWTQTLAEDIYQRRERGVDGGGEEDGRHDDEEVLDDEIDDLIWVSDRGWRRLEAECVAHDFENCSQDQERGENPAPMQIKADCVEDQAKGEYDYCEDVER